MSACFLSRQALRGYPRLTARLHGCDPGTASLGRKPPIGQTPAVPVLSTERSWLWRRVVEEVGGGGGEAFRGSGRHPMSAAGAASRAREHAFSRAKSLLVWNARWRPAFLTEYSQRRVHSGDSALAEGRSRVIHS